MIANTIAVIVVALMVTAQIAGSSPQRSDNMIFRGESVRVYGFRLSDRLEGAMDRHEERQGVFVSSTGNYDGIYADLKICGGRLFIKKFETDLERMQREHDWDSLKGAKPFRIHKWPWGRYARWFTGTLSEYYNMYPGAKSANYRVFHFRRGKLIRVEGRTS